MVERHKNKVIIVGCGPGQKAFIPPKAIYNVKKADILVGSRRLLKLFSGIEAQKIILEKNYQMLANRIADWSCTKKVVVLVSGDPCFFSYTKILLKTIGRESCVIIPGISSMQLAFAAIGESWDDACFISLHGRNAEDTQLTKKVRDHNKVGILTDSKNSPAVIARQLLKEGIRNRCMYICENLSLPEESVRQMDLVSAANIRTKGASVVIIKKG